MVAGAGPAHALYFSCYEYLKNKMMSSPHKNSHLVYAKAGVVSTALHDGVMNPAEGIYSFICFQIVKLSGFTDKKKTGTDKRLFVVNDHQYIRNSIQFLSDNKLLSIIYNIYLFIF